MKIGIDARFYNESGVGRYLRNLIDNLKVLDKENEYFVFLLPKDLEQFKETKNFKKIEANFKWYGFAEQFQFPQLLNKYKLDLVHLPHFNVPIFYPGKFVVTIHDLIHQHHLMKRVTTLNPFAFKLKQIGYKRVFKHAITGSCKILVPSTFVRQLLIDEWGISAEKILVTPEAVDDGLLTGAGKLPAVKLPYIFYVGNAHPHKNVEGLIKAYINLQKKYPDLNLVLAGGDHYFWEKIKKEYNLQGITYTGFISDEELVALYKNAEMFILPSFEEGFGLPVLEAMAVGCPVAASGAGSLREVGGEAVVYFEPGDLGDMVDKIERVLKDKNLRNSLIVKGKKRVKLFSWRKMAEQTLEVYRECG